MTEIEKERIAVSVLKPRIVSVGFSACRDNKGKIILSAHEGEKHILVELSEDECRAFANDLVAFCLKAAIDA